LNIEEETFCRFIERGKENLAEHPFSQNTGDPKWTAPIEERSVTPDLFTTELASVACCLMATRSADGFSFPFGSYRLAAIGG